MKAIAQVIKKAAKRLLPYSPRRGVRPMRIPEGGKTREGVTCIQVFPPDSFAFGSYTSLSGDRDFPPYTSEIPEYKMFVIRKGKFISGREEAFSRKGRILEEISAQKINPLTGKKLDLSPGRHISGTVLMLGLSGLENGYYHFMVELLLRWWIFRTSGMKADYYVFSSKLPFQKEALGLLGIREPQMLEAEPGTIIQADNLLCPSLVNNFRLSHLRGHELYEKIHMPRWSKDAYSFLLGKAGYGTEAPDRLVYVSRNRSARRRILNEDELLAVLKSYGFETCYLEEMGFAEQMKLFASARIVVAPHGAGLVNLVWSREGTTVLELYPEFYHDPSFRLLASAMKLDYHYAICKSPGADSVTPAEEDIQVDCLNLIDRFLREKTAENRDIPR